jgi:hypothetical protein
VAQVIERRGVLDVGIQRQRNRSGTQRLVDMPGKIYLRRLGRDRMSRIVASANATVQNACTACARGRNARPRSFERSLDTFTR